MRTTDRSRTATVMARLGLSVTIVGALGGCAGMPTGIVVAGEATPDIAIQTPAGGTYADGVYSEFATYQSPDGTENIEVTLTLSGDKVESVLVVGQGDNPNSKHYQAEFIDNIGAMIIGHRVDELKVSKVAGSSRTSGGFNDALDAIKADAAA